MSHLFIFQLGPVQSFIAAGRRTEDLYVGSRILSELAKVGLMAAGNTSGFSPIYPMYIHGQPLPHGIPHRFAFISDAEPQVVAESIKNAVNDHWRDEFAYKVYQGLEKFIGVGDWQETFQRQMEGWIEFYWVAVDYDPDNHGDCLSRANIALAQRKLLRHFPQIEEPGRKCTLTGSQSALDLDWKLLKTRLGDTRNIRFRENEYLGTIALIKRLANAKPFQCQLGLEGRKIRSTRFIAGLTDDEEDEEDELGRRQEGYLAVLHLDGDGMGKKLSHFETIKQHQQFSADLAHFSDHTVRETIQKYGGATAQLIYAGGDDVLVLLPLDSVLKFAYELQKVFFEQTGCTASAGIAITPYDFPLDVALDMAREAEEKAKSKEYYDHNAVVITEAHGTGMIRHAGGKWEIVKLAEKLYDFFKAGQLSGKIGYDLLTVAHEMGGPVEPKAREAEVTRLLRRRTAEGVSDTVKEKIEGLAGEIVSFGDLEGNAVNWESVAHWAILARFLAQPTREE